MLWFLFPLDRGDGLGAQVVQHAVDALDLGQNPVGDPVEQRVRDLLDGGGGGVHAVDRAEDDRPVPGAFVVFDARWLLGGLR